MAQQESTPPPPRRRPKPRDLEAAKREVQRLIVHERCPVELFVLDNDGKPEPSPSDTGIVFDITWKGIGLIVDRRLAPNVVVLVQLRSPLHNESHAARVVWCDALPTSNRVLKATSNFTVRMGLEFKPTDSNEKEALKKLATSL